MVGIVFKQIRNPWTVAAMNGARGEERWVGLSVASGLLTASWVRSCLRRVSCSPPVSTPHEPQKARLCPCRPQCDRASLGSSHDPWIWGFHARSIAQSKLVRLRLTAVSSGPRRAASPGEAAALPSGRPGAQPPGLGWGGAPRTGGWVLGAGALGDSSVSAGLVRLCLRPGLWSESPSGSEATTWAHTKSLAGHPRARPPWCAEGEREGIVSRYHVPVPRVLPCSPGAAGGVWEDGAPSACLSAPFSGGSAFLLSGAGWAAGPGRVRFLPRDRSPLLSVPSAVPRDGRGLWGPRCPPPGWQSRGGFRKMSPAGWLGAENLVR